MAVQYRTFFKAFVHKIKARDEKIDLGLQQLIFLGPSGYRMACVRAKQHEAVKIASEILYSRKIFLTYY